MPSFVLVLFYISFTSGKHGIVLPLYTGRHQSTENSNNYLRFTELASVGAVVSARFLKYCIANEYTDGILCVLSEPPVWAKKQRAQWNKPLRFRTDSFWGLKLL